MKGHFIQAAYVDTGALAVPCSRCGAVPGQPCTKPDGRVGKVPCVDRIATADSTPSAGIAPAIDYSQPRHPREES